MDPLFCSDATTTAEKAEQQIVVASIILVYERVNSLGSTSKSETFY